MQALGSSRWYAAALAAGLLSACTTSDEVELGPLFTPREEGSWTLPAYPRAEDLVALRAGADELDNDYFIDARSVSLGADGVVRYTVVIRAPGAGDNVLHEGLRCGVKQFKTYAFGTPGQTLRVIDGARWRSITHHRGPMAFRSILLSSYVCDPYAFPLPAERIVQRLRDGGWDRGAAQPLERGGI